MANFGIGIGSFMNGFANGANTYNQITEAKDRKKLRDIQFKQLEGEAQDKQAYRDLNRQGVEEAKAARQADISKSIIRGSAESAEGPVQPSYKVGNRSYASEEEATAAAEKEAGSFIDYYMKTTVPKLQEHWLSTGDVEKAQNIGKWMEDANVQKGVKAWAGAVRSFQTGDRDGFKRNLMAAYNQEGYFDDGVTATGIEDVNNEQGQLLGYKISFKAPDGTVTDQTFEGEDVAKLALNAMSPENVLSYGMEQIKAGQEAQSEIAKEERGFSRDVAKIDIQQGNTLEAQGNASQLRIAEEAEKARTGGGSTKVREARAMGEALKAAGWSEEKVAAEMPRLLGIYRQSQSPADRLASTVEMLTKADLDFAALPDSEKVSRAKALMDTMDAELAPDEQQGAAPAQPQVQSGRGIPVWDSKTGQVIYK